MQSGRSEGGFVFTLARSAAQTIADGYYRDVDAAGAAGLPRRSLRASIVGAKNMPVVAEIKFTSPAEGKLRKPGGVREIARSYQRGGVSGISVLTEPKHFQGDIRYLPLVKSAVEVPVLMKDVVIDPVQVDAGADMGADAVLLIAAVFTNGLARVSLEEMLSRARDRGLEVLFEAHTEKEYLLALDSEANVVGINNRDLDTLEVRLETSRSLLLRGREKRERLKRLGRDKPVISESGIKTRAEMEELRGLGADGFLVGSTLMRSSDLETRVRSLTGATG